MHSDKLPNGESKDYFHSEDRVFVKGSPEKKGWINEIVLDDRTSTYIARVYIDGDDRPTYFKLTEIEKVKEEK